MKTFIFIVAFFIIVWIAAVSKQNQQIKEDLPPVVDARIDDSQKAQENRIILLNDLIEKGIIKDLKWSKNNAFMQVRPKWSRIDFDDRSAYCQTILSYVHVKTKGKVTYLKMISSINKRSVSYYTFDKGLKVE